jgi:hypothetical protein
MERTPRVPDFRLKAEATSFVTTLRYGFSLIHASLNVTCLIVFRL